jgi:predicted metal-binding transcription factor (methanogenesis marker protein 9)
MANDERLGASFNIDVTNLKAGLAQANRLIRESNSEFRAAAAGLDDWTKSETGLNAKIKSLNQITEIQRKKVDALQNEYNNLIANGLDPTSKQAVDLRTKINNETAALNKNEVELRKQTTALNDLGNETKKAGNATDETSGKFSKLGEVTKGAAKVALAAVGATAAAVGALVKQAVESYAEYEQLVGGVDTLFGSASAEVQKKADNAYKTAGMSANEYMETVTGFSASLIQSLGGDTEKAAKYADMAITDMSDNANKMGTDMSLIQNAYQGFAKQNYTMLDNLKLGYGGTKEEMERLLKDASKISGIKYDISSYADIVDAIHVVQTEMGITGTTAKEASTTIQGSISSMKSAWQNLLTGLADENADLDGLVTNMIESVGTVVENVLPKISVAAEGIVSIIQNLIPQIPPLIEQLLPPLLEGALSLIQGLVTILPEITSTITGMLPSVLTSLVGMTPEILTAILTIITELLNSITGMLPTIVEAIMQVVPELITSLVAAIPQLLEAAIQFLLAIVEAVPTIITSLVDALPLIVSTIISTLLSNLPMLQNAAFQMFFGIIKAIPEIIVALSKEMPNIIKGITDGLVKGIPELVKTGGNMLKGLFDGLLDITAIGNAVKKLFNGIVGGLKEKFGIHSPSKVMADIIGKNLALGIGSGFEKNIGAVNREISKSLNFDDASVNINANGAKSGGGLTVYQTNNYKQAYTSPVEKYKSKQQLYAAARLIKAGAI